MRKSVFEDEKKLKEIVKISKTYMEVIKHFKLNQKIKGSGNYITLKKFIKKYNINISHFDSSSKKREALLIHTVKATIPLEKILSGEINYVNGCHLKNKLYKEKIKYPICENCNQRDFWKDKKLTMHLEHVDGDRTNNKIENLKILCPNCHSQTKTYSRKKHIEISPCLV